MGLERSDGFGGGLKAWGFQRVWGAVCRGGGGGTRGVLGGGSEVCEVKGGWGWQKDVGVLG